MPNSYPLRFPAQLRQHLRALRKARDLTQAQLGGLIGVSQARIAEIEANPGLVRFEQLMQVLSALGATLSLSEDLSGWQAPDQAKRVSKTSKRSVEVSKEQAVPTNYRVRVPEGWQTALLRSGPAGRATGALVARSQAEVPSNEKGTPAVTPSEAPDFSMRNSSVAVLKKLRTENPDFDVQPTSRRNFVVRPKKGTW